MGYHFSHMSFVLLFLEWNPGSTNQLHKFREEYGWIINPTNGTVN
jgi:hypothetical protein